MNRSGPVRVGTAAGLVVALGVLVACTGDDGGSDFAESPPEEIVEAAKTAMGELTSVKVSGDIENDGQQVTLDLQANADGDCTGSIGVGASGGSAELLGVDGTTWMRPDDAMWQEFAGADADTVRSLVGDKWVVVPSGDDSFNTFCDVNELLDQMLEDDEDDESTYTNARTEDLDGDEVVAVDNEDPEDGTSTGYVLVDEPHYLVQIEKTEGEDTGSITFSEFDADFEVEAPAEDDVVDLDTLGS